MARFETGVTLSMAKSGSESWSSILDPQTNSQGADQSLPEGFEMPRALDSASARNSVFQFRPDGSTNLSGNRQWTLTLLHEKDTARTELPPNFVSIVIDPLNGRVHTLSP